jgi:hypothetical protein
LNATEDREWLRRDGQGLPVIEGRAIEPFRVNLKLASRSMASRDARARLGDRPDRTRLAYRDVASAGNRLTLIAALLPARSVSTHTVFCLRTPLPVQAQHFLCGLFNSFVVNYLVRLRVATHVTTAIVERLPVPRSGYAPAVFEEIAAIARLLGGPEPAPSTIAAEALARLQARVGKLYQLTRDEFAHVLATFPLVSLEDRDAAFRAFTAQR